MRPFEWLVALADLLALVALAIPARVRLRWLPLAAPLAAAAQLLAEGPRPQMYPAYALAGLCAGAAAVQLARVPLRRTAALARWLGAPLLAASVALPVALPVFSFPAPTGPEAVGTVTYRWADPSRHDPMVDGPGDGRELLVQIWYPARRGAGGPRAPYLPDSDAVLAAFGEVQGKPVSLLTNLRAVTTDATLGAPAAEGRHPVLIFLEGASGFRQMNTFQVVELASHGYVVAAIDQPGAAAAVVFPGGREVRMPPLGQIMPRIRASYHPAGPESGDDIVPFFAQDVSFALDRLAELDRSGALAGRLDMQRAGVFGVSLGGIVAAEACRRDGRLRACLMMDSPVPSDVVAAGLAQPCLWFTRPAADMRLERERSGGWPEDEIALHQGSMRAAFARLGGAGYLVSVAGTFHANFTDVPRWSPLLRPLGVVGPLDGARAHAIVDAYTLAFFDRHLRGLPAPLLDAAAPPYPEVTVERR